MIHVTYVGPIYTVIKITSLFYFFLIDFPKILDSNQNNDNANNISGNKNPYVGLIKRKEKI